MHCLYLFYYYNYKMKRFAKKKHLLFLADLLIITLSYLGIGGAEHTISLEITSIIIFHIILHIPLLAV